MRGENLPGQKRTAEQRDQDREEIAALLVQGRSLREITEGLNATRPYGLSRQQVAKDADAVRAEFCAVVSRRRKEVLGETWATLTRVQREGWRAWNESAKGGRADPRYLRLILDGLALKARLAGLGQQKHQAPSLPPQGFVPLARVELPEERSEAAG